VASKGLGPLKHATCWGVREKSKRTEWTNLEQLEFGRDPSSDLRTGEDRAKQSRRNENQSNLYQVPTHKSLIPVDNSNPRHQPVTYRSEWPRRDGYEESLRIPRQLFLLTHLWEVHGECEHWDWADWSNWWHPHDIHYPSEEEGWAQPRIVRVLRSCRWLPLRPFDQPLFTLQRMEHSFSSRYHASTFR